MEGTSTPSKHWASTVHPVIAAARATLNVPQDNSREKLLSCVWQYVKPTSVVDFGCGLGLFLADAKRMGAHRVLGLDIPEVDVTERRLEASEFMATDFTRPLTLANRFDLALSLEVGEHLPLPFASTFIKSLCGASDLILFGAAIPYQGGMGHVNENWLEFWQQLFHAEGYAAFDIVRPALWTDASVTYYYKQNTILYASGCPRQTLLTAGLRPSKKIHSYIHPDMYIKAVNRSLPPKKRSLASDILHYYYLANNKLDYSQEQTYGQELLNFIDLYNKDGKSSNIVR